MIFDVNTLPFTVALAVSAKAPLWLPAAMTMLATPFASVRALAAPGVKLALLSLLFKVSKTPDSTAPLPSFTTACTVALLPGLTEVVALPAPSFRLSARVAGTGVTGTTGVTGGTTQPGRFGLRPGSKVLQSLLPEPPPPQPASNVTAVPAARHSAQRAGTPLLINPDIHFSLLFCC